MLSTITEMKLAVLTLSASLLASCATPSQMYWDAKVKELCEKDGGVTVYERVELSNKQYELLKDFRGAVRAPVEKYARPYDLLLSTSERIVLHKESPVVDRVETKIFLRSDMRMLGREVSYARVGGDVPTGISHPSVFSCGDVDGFVGNINKLIYTVKGE